MKLYTRFAVVAAVLAATVAVAQPVPQEASIRKGLAANMSNLPKIDEIRSTPIAGLFEVRVGSELFYTDAEGGYAFRGEIFDLKTRRNLTEERVNKLNAIDFAQLPLKDAIVWKTGTGKRRIAVFADPNCGYCKRFEAELGKVKDLTVYTFLMPILGGDSPQKSEAIWCAKDSTTAWRAWMVEGTAPPKAAAKCSTPIERNLELGRKHRVDGTPAIVFEDGSRVPGMLTAPQLEQRLAAPAKAS
ncbi:DsbC family protein [Rivibacter subsaxonicus]|uniref:Thiol:disulfide interchange protein n=1 Tax=Rivibacter subsaxonicus TaxID=457575 RepID=A0A4Q7VGS4_9BURK|nr:DsbC family protein [Rivibacter subsaxonicus]RZT95217.1 thiol:disulfide interchange protein DsbC [Rivibacter subsaxonicus]